MLRVLPQTLRRLVGYVLPTTEPPAESVFSESDRELLDKIGLELGGLAADLLAGRRPRGWGYRAFTQAKPGGGLRQLAEPDPPLKELQRQLVDAVLNKRQPHPAALGFRRGKSAADHAWAHAGAALVITADIADFFPSTHARRVQAWWRAQGCSEALARVLARLTTHRGALPQGAPTSPPLSNLVNVELDQALHAHARQGGAAYTRYADDLAWSWPDGAGPQSDFAQRVAALLGMAGYRLNPAKSWRVATRREAPVVAGLVLTPQGGVALPPELLAAMRALERSDDPRDRRRLEGYRAYQAMVEAGGPRGRATS
jgi:hypothetical protein